MSGSWIGSVGTGQSSAIGATSIAPAFGAGQGAAAGHTILCALSLTNSSGSVPTSTETTGLYTLDHSFNQTNGTTNEKIFLYRLRTNDNAPSAPAFTVSAGANAVGIARLYEWDEWLALDQLFTGSGRANSVGAITVPPSGSVTTTSPNELILGVEGGRGTTGDAWSGAAATALDNISVTIGGTTVAVGLGYSAVTAIQSAVTITDTVTGTANAKALIGASYIRIPPAPHQVISQYGGWF